MNVPDALSVSDPVPYDPSELASFAKSGLALLGRRQNVLHPYQPCLSA